MENRKSGVLCPLPSIPGTDLVGSMGGDSYSFIDTLSEAGIHYWQILPLNMVDRGGCPYASPSSFGGEPLYLGLPELGLSNLTSEAQSGPIDYELLFDKKQKALVDWAKAQIKDTHFWGESILPFLKKYSWLHDLCIFLSLRDSLGDYWTHWPEQFHQFEDGEKFILQQEEEAYKTHIILQFYFHKQWQEVREYARDKNVQLIGDIPIFVSADSFDTWRWRHLFKVDQDTGKPYVITGAPPDEFSTEGQLWGTVNYNWSEPDTHKWWLDRLNYCHDLYDVTRIDHFVGLYHVWESAYDAPNALDGIYVKSTGRALLEKIKASFPEMPFIAEDLGVITDDIRKLRKDFDLPSMRVYQFSLEEKGKIRTGKDNEHRPENITEDCFYYSGTHDNNTIRGWLDDCLEHPFYGQQIKMRFGDLGPEKSINIILKEILESKARCCIFPLADIFGLDESNRINIPGTTSPENWSWRMNHLLWDENTWSSFIKLLNDSKRSFSAHDHIEVSL